MPDQPSLVCTLAQVRHASTARWLQLYNLLIFVLAAIVVVFLAIALLFFARSDSLAGVVAAAGTVVTGTATAWVLKRRGDANKEEAEAFAEVKTLCADAGAGDQVRNATTFLGRR